MYREKYIAKFFVIIMLISIINVSILATPQVEANNQNTIAQSENNEIIGYVGEQQTKASSNTISNYINNNYFYIKNAFSSQYLDLYNSEVHDGSNIMQYPFNGGLNQKWYIETNGDGTVTIYSGIDQTYVLDINGGTNSDLTNVQLWSYNGSDAQKFKIGFTEKSVYAIMSKVSNYQKVVVTHGAGCAMGDNVNQYTYTGNWNEVWILEPVAVTRGLGVQYAKDNYDDHVYAYPDLHNFNGDCTNFVSQCLLAGGYHYNNGWGTYRKNGTYTFIYNVDQLNESWSLADPSPWISAKQFKKYWEQKTTVYKLKGTEILKDSSKAWNLPITTGCVIQKADNFLGIMGDSTHSMYITAYANNTYLLTYHSNDIINKPLTDFCRQEPDAYYLFYVF